MGNKEYNDELEEYTAKRFANDLEKCKEFLKRSKDILNGDSNLTDSERLNIRLFQSELKTFIDGYKHKG